MTTQRKSLSRLSSLVLGGLLAALPATAAFAEKPTTAAEAQAKADHYRDRAEQFRLQGGFTYKVGLVQRAEAEAAHYDAVAAELSGQAEPASPQPKPLCDVEKPSVQPPDCVSP